MRIFKIRHRHTGTVLYEGLFPSFKHCLEKAVADNACLEFADLSGSNLLNACLDNARLRGAMLQNCNLLGANLSEAQLDACDFTNAYLKDTCFCQSSLTGATFRGAAFGGTDIAGCNISRSLFSTLSAFHLNFTDTDEMTLCLYEDEQRRTCCSFSRPPLTITGLAYPVICMDGHIKIGPWLGKIGALLSAINDNGQKQPSGIDGRLLDFIKAHALLIRLVLQVRPTTALISRRLSA